MGVSNVIPQLRKSFPAGSGSLNQFQFVAVNTSGQIVTPSATGVFALVLDDAPSLAASSSLGSESTGGQPSGGYTVGTNYGCVLPSAGRQKVITGASFNPGVAVMTDTSGHAVAAVTGAVVLGWTLAASNSGDIVDILLSVAAHY